MSGSERGMDQPSAPKGLNALNVEPSQDSRSLNERPLVLSLFPGLGLLDKAFEEVGFTVVRGPDLIWGGDVRQFEVPAGVFEGVIGGPPCKAFSQASGFKGTERHEDLIPEFMRIVQEAQPLWVVMENVVPAQGHPLIPSSWRFSKIRDWDCGGLTHRRRGFWTFPFKVQEPKKRPGDPEYAVLASNYISRSEVNNIGTHASLTVEEAQRLQGWEVPELIRHSKRLSIHLLGNGVPRAMGLHVARRAKRFSEGLKQLTG